MPPNEKQSPQKKRITFGPKLAKIVMQKLRTRAYLLFSRQCVVFSRKCKFANLFQYNMQYVLCNCVLLAQGSLFSDLFLNLDVLNEILRLPLNTNIPLISGKYGLKNHFWPLESRFFVRKSEKEGPNSKTSQMQMFLGYLFTSDSFDRQVDYKISTQMQILESNSIYIFVHKKTKKLPYPIFFFLMHVQDPGGLDL